MDILRASLPKGIDRVATAHTATDQAETLLFRWRGGPDWGGRHPPRCGGVPAALLGLTRAETEARRQASGAAALGDR